MLPSAIAKTMVFSNGFHDIFKVIFAKKPAENSKILSLCTLWFILNPALPIENTFKQPAIRGSWLAHF